MTVEPSGDVAGNVSGLAAEATERLNDAAKYARDMGDNAAKAARAASARAASYAESAMKEQPLLSLIGVAAIGYAIGFLIHSQASPLAVAPPKPRYRIW